MKISILTPNFNYAKYIGQTIESVIYQNYYNIEHIIIDDGSTDKSAEIIQKYANRFPNIIKFEKQENAGQTIALNKALNKASGDIIAWINSDDYYCENVFPKIISYFSKDPSIDAIFGDIQIVDELGNIIKVNRYLNFDYASGVFNGFGKIISSNAIFWKRESTDFAGLFDSSYKYAMDSEYWSRLLYGRRVKHIPLVIASFRWHADSKTKSRQKKNTFAYKRARIEDKNIFLNSYKNLFFSKFLPVKLTWILKILFKFKRIFLRFFNGHYFIKK